MEKKELGSRAKGSLGSFVPPLPVDFGQWSGAAGDSDWMFDLNAKRYDIYSSDPLATAPWGATIRKSEYPNADRVNFANNYPDFSPFLITVTCGNLSLDGDFTFPVSDFSVNRSDNLWMADEWVASYLGVSHNQFHQFRSKRKYTWHEVETCTQMLLVPRVIHGYVRHGGGVEMMKHGGPGSIGGAQEDLQPLEERTIAGRTAQCGRGLCRVKQTFQTEGSFDEVQVIFYCEEKDGIPDQSQLDQLERLKESWSQVKKTAWTAVQNYVEQEWGTTSRKNSEESVRLAFVQIFPKAPDAADAEVGFYYNNFAEDMEHDLGARLLGGRIIDVGPGDVAI